MVLIAQPTAWVLLRRRRRKTSLEAEEEIKKRRRSGLCNQRGEGGGGEEYDPLTVVLGWWGREGGAGEREHSLNPTRFYRQG